MKRKKIVIDARMLLNSGIGVYLEYYIKGIVRSNDFEVTLIGNEEIIISKFGSGFIKNIINLHTPIYSIKEQLLLPFIIPVCDIFWSPHYNVPILPIRAKKRIVTIPDTYHITYSKTLGIFKQIYAKLMVNRAADLSNNITTISAFSKSEILAATNCCESKVSAIHIGVDLDKFKYIYTAGNIIKEKLSLPDKYILFVGNVKPNKNLVNLLAAFQRIIEIDNTCYLVIAGKKDGFLSGDNKVFDILKTSPELQRHVIFTGYVEEGDLPLVYNSALLLAFPSIYEGFGLPPLEAMGCECPVVVSSTASLPEVCGDAARYVDPFDINSIFLGLMDVITNTDFRTELINKGRERVKKFSWDKSVEKFIEILKE